MSTFAISYAGVDEVQSKLRELSRQIEDVGHDLYSTANDAGNVASLADEGYGGKIRSQSKDVVQTGEEVGSAALCLKSIVPLYSDTEKRIISNLNDVVSSTEGFSGESLAIVNGALVNYRGAQGYDESLNLLEYMEERFDSLKSSIEGFRYWRSTEGSKMVQKAVQAVLGKNGMNNPIVQEAIGLLNAKVEPCEDLVYAVINPTNPSALKRGAEAVVGALGFGGFAKEVSRYSKMTDAISDRAGEIAASGHMGKAIAYGVAATCLETVQFVGDSAYNSFKYISDAWIDDAFKVKKPRKNASEAVQKQYAKDKREANWGKKATKKGIGTITGVLEDSFTDIGDWCWSRLDGAFGL